MKNKIKIFLLFIFILSSSANAQYNFSFVNRYAPVHAIVHTNLKKIFDDDAKHLRENKVKSVTVWNESEPDFERYDINTRGFTENLFTKNELFLQNEQEEDVTEFNIKYNVGGLISYIYFSPDETAFFYEHDIGKLSAIKSESYGAIEYYAKFYYVNDLPDSLYTESSYNNIRRISKFKIENDDAGYYKKIIEVGTGKAETVLEVVNSGDTIITVKTPEVNIFDDNIIFYNLREDFDNQKYLSFEVNNDKINSFTTLKKIAGAIYKFKMDFTYQPNGLIESVTISKSSGLKKITQSYKYKYEHYK
jgi:hypothetical protein